MASEQVISSHVTELQLKLIATESARYLGYATLEDEQLEAVVTFSLGNDCFIALPTGCRKSAMYTLLLSLLKGLFLVILACSVLFSVDTICSTPIKIEACHFTG